MAGDVDRELLAHHLFGGHLTQGEATRLAAAMLPESVQAFGDMRPFTTLEEGQLPDGTPYRLRAVQIHEGESIGLGIDGHGGTSTNWLIKRESLEQMLAICDGKVV